MKTLILMASLIIGITNANAAKVVGAKLDASQRNILVDVVHGGGCGTHDYRLEVNPSCLESYPVQCTAKLVHISDDICEALLFKTAVFSLDELGLTDAYYSGASLRITGSKDWETGLLSSKVVVLPKM